jgi:hypothetical protein
MGGDPIIDPGPWELHSNWRRWFGWDIRRAIYDNTFHNGGWCCGWWWQYGRSKTVAREMLHRAYGEGMPRSNPDPSAMTFN